MVKGKQLKFCKIYKICISSTEFDVYNKNKIQMFVVNMTFISSREVTKCIFHSCLREVKKPDQTVRMHFIEVKNVYFIRAFGTHEI